RPSQPSACSASFSPPSGAAATTRCCRSLFRRRGFSAANGAAAAMNLGALGALFVLTLFLQTVQGRSPLEAGLVLVPLFVPLAVLVPPAGRLAGRFGPRLSAVARLVVSAAGLALLARAGAGAGLLDLVPSFLLWGCGLGVLTPAVVAAAIAAVPPERAGLASAVSNIARQTGGAVGIAVAGAAAGSPARAGSSTRSTAWPSPPRRSTPASPSRAPCSFPGAPRASADRRPGSAAAGAGRLRLEQPRLVREHDRLHAVAEVELLEDVRDVRLHRRVADEEPPADLGVREALGEQAVDVALARGQLGDRLRQRRPRGAGELRDHAPRHRGGEQRVAGGDRADRGDQLLGRVVLQHEPARARAQGLVDVLVEVERRQDQDARLRVGGED